MDHDALGPLRHRLRRIAHLEGGAAPAPRAARPGAPHGRAKPVDALVRDATGSPLDVEPCLAYLRAKYEALTGVAAPTG